LQQAPATSWRCAYHCYVIDFQLLHKRGCEAKTHTLFPAFYGLCTAVAADGNRGEGMATQRCTAALLLLLLQP
jgi:hypothetical protein